jgi:hypothetical protein
MVAIQAGTQTAASIVAVGAAVSRAAEEPKRPIASGGAMFGSVVGRERRRLWAILSFLFALGFAVSTFMVHAERNGAFDSVAKLARDDAQLLTATLTGKQLTKPVTGSSYDRLAAKIRRSVSTKGSIVGVTVWSSQGQILFSLNESLVGTTPPEMQTLIVGISQGPGGTRVLDDTVQTFMPVSKATGGPVAVVELDQPFAFVEARIGGFWSMLRLGFAFGLAVSLLLLGLTLVSSRSLARAPEDDERQAEGDEGADMEAEGQPEEPPTGEPAPTFEEDLQALQPYFDAYFDGAVDQDKDLEGDVDSQESMRQRRDEFKARAKEAELRVKKLEAELHEAPSAPQSEQ